MNKKNIYIQLPQLTIISPIRLQTLWQWSIN